MRVWRLHRFVGCVLRLASRDAGADTGKGMEIIVLTAAILGGIRLGGGKGSVAKAVLGTLIVFLITNGLLRLAVPAGEGISF